MTSQSKLAVLHARFRRPRQPWAIAAVAATLLSSCYEYAAPVSGVAVPGTDVQATLTDLGSAQLGGLIGPRVVSLDGRLERAGGDSVVLVVRKLTLMNGGENAWGGERLAIPASAVSSIRERQLNRSRTAIGIAVGVGGLITALIAQHVARSSEPPITGAPIPGGQYRGAP